LTELKDTVDQASQKLQPLLQKAQAGEIESTAEGMSYLEMKYNLMISYCTFLSFYVLLKLEGKDVSEHPVLLKLAHLRAYFEKLKPLDNKLQYQIDKMVANASGQEQALKYKPQLKDLKLDSESEGEPQAAAGSDSDAGSDAQVYKAPKASAVAYEDKAMRKQKQRD
jgi:hypothetical protein